MRVQAYDQGMAEKEKAAKEQALKEEAQRWAEREISAREAEWQKAELLDKRADQMMQFPLQEVTRKTETEVSGDGKTVINHITVIKPARWSYRNVLNLIALADRLRRLSCGLENERTTVQETGEGRSVIPEDIEAIRRKRWLEAAPAIAALIQEKMAEAQNGHDGNGTEPNTG